MENEGLQALHHPRIKSAKVDISVEGKHDIAYMFFDDTKQYAAIEKDLKRLEQLEIMYSNCVIEGAKQKKELEIIKKKQVNIFLFKECCKNKWKMPYSYNQSQNKRRQLNEEECDLLKEVLK